MNSKFNSTIIGSIGEDDNGTLLKNELEKQGVLTRSVVGSSVAESFFTMFHLDMKTFIINANHLFCFFFFSATQQYRTIKLLLFSFSSSKTTLHPFMAHPVWQLGSTE